MLRGVLPPQSTLRSLRGEKHSRRAVDLIPRRTNHPARIRQMSVARLSGRRRSTRRKTGSHCRERRGMHVFGRCESHLVTFVLRHVVFSCLETALPTTTLTSLHIGTHARNNSVKSPARTRP